MQLNLVTKLYLDLVGHSSYIYSQINIAYKIIIKINFGLLDHKIILCE